MEDEDDLPEPPPLPSVEYLLGKRPVNLRKRIALTLKEQIKERAATMGNVDDPYDSDSHSSVGSSQSDKHKHHRRKHKKKKSPKSTTNSEEQLQEGHILQSSPHRTKRTLPGVERFPTPIPAMLSNSRFIERMPIQQKLDFDGVFDEVTNELEALANSPSSLSPYSPSPKSPISSVESSPAHTFQKKKTHPTRKAPKPPLSHASTTQKDTTVSQAAQKSSKRGGPKLLPHQKNKQETQNNQQTSINSVSSSALKQPKKGGLGRKLNFFRSKKQKQEQVSMNDSTLASEDPAQFIDVLSQAIKSSPKQPRFMRQASHDTKSNQLESASSMDIDEIESQLNEMKLMLESAAGSTMPKESRRPPSPEPSEETSDTESDSTEYTSSSDEETTTSDTEDSSSEDSSDEDRNKKKLSGPRRPIMARNIGMAGNPRAKGMGFNRARMLSRYPRLLGRRIIHLETVEEASEEIIYLAVSVY